MDYDLETRRGLILTSVADLVSNLLYYDRKEDEELEVGAIEEAIKAGEVTVEEIVAVFSSELRDGLKDDAE